MPLGSPNRVLNGLAPLADAPFLPDMDFLSCADQADDDAPFGNAICKLNEQFGFRLAACSCSVALVGYVYHRRVECTLGLVVHQDMLGWDLLAITRVGLDVVLHVSN